MAVLGESSLSYNCYFQLAKMTDGKCDVQSFKIMINLGWTS